MMINLKPGYVEGGWLREGNMNYAVRETDSLTKWEAIRMISHMKTLLVFDQPTYDRHVMWFTWVTLTKSFHQLVRDCQDGYEEAFRKSVGL
jgi:hypothetical protein